MSNNETEYEAVLLGLRVARQLSVTSIKLRCDSQLVSSQLQGEYEAQRERMEQFLRLARSLMAKFEQVNVTQIPLRENQMADVLASLAFDALYSCNIELNVMDRSSISRTPVLATDNHDEPCWMTPITSYLKSGDLPENKSKVVEVKSQAA